MPNGGWCKLEKCRTILKRRPQLRDVCAFVKNLTLNDHSQGEFEFAWLICCAVWQGFVTLLANVSTFDMKSTWLRQIQKECNNGVFLVEDSVFLVYWRLLPLLAQRRRMPFWGQRYRTVSTPRSRRLPSAEPRICPTTFGPLPGIPWSVGDAAHSTPLQNGPASAIRSHRAWGMVC